MMNRIIENSLFKENPDQFKKIRQYAKEFNASYNGNNIIQDDIFTVACNYAAKNNTHLELFKIPVNDEDFCAFTCIRNGELFTVINSAMPLCKQNFAAAHELYHIWCYISNQDDSLSHTGSLLTSEDMSELAASKEDMEANAFAALLLAPASALNEQIDVYGLDKNSFNIDSLVRLMDIFAIPFKAMVLRLFEEGLINETQTNDLLIKGTENDISNSMRKQNLALRWQRCTADNIDMGSLPALIEQNYEYGYLPEMRIMEDKEILEEIEKWFLKSEV